MLSSFCLQVNNRVGVKRCTDGTMHVYINGEDMGVAATNVPKVSLRASPQCFKIEMSIVQQMYTETDTPQSYLVERSEMLQKGNMPVFCSRMTDIFSSCQLSDPNP